MQFASQQAAFEAFHVALTGPAPAKQLRELLTPAVCELFDVPSTIDPAPLDRVPAEPLCRWWALACLTGCRAAGLGRIFGLHGRLLAGVSQLEALYAAGPAPDLPRLKARLSGELPVDWLTACRAFAAFDERFAGQEALLRQLAESRQPYRIEHLAVTPAELLAEGLPAKQLAQLQQALLKVVLAQPELNTYPVLVELARSLLHFMK